MNRALAFVHWLGARLSEFLHVVMLCRVSLLIALIAFVLLWKLEQGLEAFRAMAEDVVSIPEGEGFGIRGYLTLALTAFVLSAVGWWCARAVTFFEEREAGPSHPFPPWLRLWIPRVCCALPLAGVALGSWSAADPYAEGRPERVHLLIFASLLALAAVAVPLLSMSGRMLGLEPVPEAVRSRLQRPHMATLGLPLVVIGLGALFLLAVTHQPWLALRLGNPLAVLLLAFTCMVPIWMVIQYWGRVLHLPLMTICLGLAVFFSVLEANDNHELRFVEPAGASSGSTTVAGPGTELSQAFVQWLEGRADRDRYDVYPIVILAAEGGGLRAAYFTSQVLARLQDECPLFAQHVFAISGVSGGSLGAALFGALAADTATNAAGNECSLGTPHSGNVFATRARSFFAQDFLSPLAATTLFPDLIQRFLFFPVPAFDRARTLELSLGRAWDRLAGIPIPGVASPPRMTPGVFEASYYDFPHAAPSRAVPALIFNTTHVESGNRMVISPFWTGAAPFARVDKLVEALPLAHIPLSTAAVASARFPLVTPAAYVRRSGPPTREGVPGEPRKMRYVDGGYYDNSGTATLQDLYTNLKELQSIADSAEPGRLTRFRLVVVWIGNGPLVNPGLPGEQPLRTEAMWLGELLSPLRTMLNVREARSDESVRRLERLVSSEGDTWIEFRLVSRGTPLPLGWLLSYGARDEMDTQISNSSKCKDRDLYLGTYQPPPLRRVDPQHNACGLATTQENLVRTRRR